MAEVANTESNTAEGKILRKNLVSLIRDINDAKKTVDKYYPDGIKEFDTAVLDNLYEKENLTEQKLFELLKKMKEAKENRNNAEFASIRTEIETCRKEKAEIQKQIKQATKAYSNYRRAVKPYLDAVKTVTQAENYGCLDTIEAIYNEKS